MNPPRSTKTTHRVRLNSRLLPTVIQKRGANSSHWSGYCLKCALTLDPQQKWHELSRTVLKGSLMPDRHRILSPSLGLRYRDAVGVSGTLLVFQDLVPRKTIWHLCLGKLSGRHDYRFHRHTSESLVTGVY